MNTENLLKELSSTIQYPSSMCLVNSKETKEQKIAFCDRQMKTIDKIERSSAFKPFIIDGLRATRDWWFNERIRIEKGASFDSYFYDCLKGDQSSLIKEYIQSCHNKTNNIRLQICQDRWGSIDSCSGYGLPRGFWAAEIGALQYHIAISAEAPVTQPSHEAEETINDWDSFKKLLISNSILVLLAFAVTCEILTEADSKFLENVAKCFALLLAGYILTVGSAFNPGQDIQYMMRFIYQGGN